MSFDLRALLCSKNKCAKMEYNRNKNYKNAGYMDRMFCKTSEESHTSDTEKKKTLSCFQTHWPQSDPQPNEWRKICNIHEQQQKMMLKNAPASQHVLTFLWIKKMAY